MHKHQSSRCAFGLDDCPNRKAETADGVMSARPGTDSQCIMIYIASGISAGRQRGASLRFIWLFVPVLPPPLKLLPLQLVDRPSSRSSVCTHVTGSFKEGGYPSFRFFPPAPAHFLHLLLESWQFTALWMTSTADRWWASDRPSTFWLSSLLSVRRITISTFFSARLSSVHPQTAPWPSFHHSLLHQFVSQLMIMARS